MKLRPLGNKILIKKVEKLTNIILTGDAERENVDIVVEALGENVTIDVKIGDEVVLFQGACVISTAKKELKNYGLVAEQDIWGVIEK